MKEFEDKSHLLKANSLNDMVDDVVRVRVLISTLELGKFTKMPESHVRKTLKKFQENNKITLTIIQNIESNLI